MSELNYAVKLYCKCDDNWIDESTISTHRTRQQARVARKEYEANHTDKLSSLAHPRYRVRVVKL